MTKFNLNIQIIHVFKNRNNSIKVINISVVPKANNKSFGSMIFASTVASSKIQLLGPSIQRRSVT